MPRKARCPITRIDRYTSRAKCLKNSTVVLRRRQPCPRSTDPAVQQSPRWGLGGFTNGAMQRNATARTGSTTPRWPTEVEISGPCPFASALSENSNLYAKHRMVHVGESIATNTVYWTVPVHWKVCRTTSTHDREEAAQVHRGIR